MCGEFNLHGWFDTTSVFAFAHACAVQVVSDLYCIMQRMAR